MKTVSEIKEVIDSLSAKLSELKDDVDAIGVSGGGVAATADKRDELAVIEAKAVRTPITNKGLAAATDTARQAYMRFLASVAAGSPAKLEMARRIGAGSGSDWGAERLLAEGMNPPARFAVEIAENLRELALPLVMDSLMVACQDGSADDAEIALAAEAADLLGVSGEDAAVVARLASACLAGDEEKFFAIEANCAYPGMSHHIPAEWIGPVTGSFVCTFRFTRNKEENILNTCQRLREKTPRGENMLKDVFRTQNGDYDLIVGFKKGEIIKYEGNWLSKFESLPAPLSGFIVTKIRKDKEYYNYPVVDIFIRSFFAETPSPADAEDE
ncbi:MAG: hypothetical protein LBG12_11355 [Synergistaceae bacterium]|jgi:hypothetical protein|nr:hypothetical protein [Synergistaceae bacterium]